MIFDEGGVDRDVMRIRILDYLRESKFESVIDVGGASDPWAREFVTLYVDLWEPEEYLQRYPDNLEDGLVQKTPFIVSDLDNPVTWTKINDFSNGKKFDFAICSHTVEHLANPYITLKMLPQIAKEGYIAMPSKYTELKRGRHFKHCRGIVHHRWIGTVRDGEFWLFPKFTFIEAIEFAWADQKWGEHREKHGELGFRWKDDIPFNIISERYTYDPEAPAIVDFYIKELEIGL